MHSTQILRDTAALEPFFARCAQAMMLQDSPDADCFERGVHMLIVLRTLPRQTPTDGRWRLCHGIVKADLTVDGGKPAAYAWLENGAVVFDPSAGKLYHKADYYMQGRIADASVRTYTVPKMQKHMAQDKHAGPYVLHLTAPDVHTLTGGQPHSLRQLPGLMVGVPA